MSFDWKAAIGAAAPAVATALGGPLAGVAVGTLLSFFGLPADSDEEALKKAVQGMTPDQVIQLRKVDAEFKTKMVQAQVDLEKINQLDRASARKMATTTGVWFQVLLTCFCVGVFTFGMYLVITGQMANGDEFAKQLVTYAMGQVTTWIGVAIAFFFGSSKSSQDKDTTISKLSEWE